MARRTACRAAFAAGGRLRGPARLLRHDFRRLRRDLGGLGSIVGRLCAFVDHGRQLPDDFLGRLVFAHALERGLADEPVRGPAAEVRFDHQLGLDPANVATAAFGVGDLIERRLGDLQRMQPLPQIARHRLAVAGADAPGIDQSAIVVIADHQSADRPRQHARRRIAADHEFLGVRAFGLDEGLAAAGAVGRIGALRHDAFERHAAGLLQHQRAVLVEMLAVADHVADAFGLVQQALELRLALAQRQLAQVAAVEMQQVEDVVDEGVAPALLEGGLQHREHRDAALVLDHDLAVDQRGVAPAARRPPPRRWEICSVQSRPLRVSSRTSPRSSRAWMR